MELNAAERWLVNNPARALVQRFYEMPLLRRLGGSVAGGRVLEVGCGRRVGLPLLLTEFGAAHVDGVDLDPRQVRRAQLRLGKRYAGRIDLHMASVEELPFADDSFDAVFDFGMLHHVPGWQGAVAEIGRILKPGGTLFFEEVTRAALERWSYRTFLKHPQENRFSEAEFLEVLRACGLNPAIEIRRLLFGDIFIGVAKRRDVDGTSWRDAVDKQDRASAASSYKPATPAVYVFAFKEPGQFRRLTRRVLGTSDLRRRAD